MADDDDNDGGFIISKKRTFSQFFDYKNEIE